MDIGLGRRPHRGAPALTVWDGAMRLARGRVHEGCGRARRRLAVRIAAAAGGGPVLWIAPAHGATLPNPAGLASILPPRALLFVTPERPIDALWAMEEALRSGAAPVVIADLPDPPGMTPVRRLHLAAEAGAETGLSCPLGLILTPGDGGAPGIETRWRFEPAHEPDADAWMLTRLRARMEPPKTWRITGDGRAEPSRLPEPA